MSTDLGDPDRIIEEWSEKLFEVPTWADKKLPTCHQCDKKFSRGKQHNCRLCGHNFCSNCTLKANVPDKYRLKGKQGPVRVCMGCRNTCMVERERLHKDVVTERRKNINMVADEEIGRLHVYPPLQYLDVNWFTDCGICGNVLKKDRSNCSACGDVFCMDCVHTDITVPKDFPKPVDMKNHRLCKSCRFIIAPGDQTVFEATPPRPYSKFAGIKGINQPEYDGQEVDRVETTLDYNAVPKLFFQEKLAMFCKDAPSSKKTQPTLPRRRRRKQHGRTDTSLSVSSMSSGATSESPISTGSRKYRTVRMKKSRNMPSMDEINEELEDYSEMLAALDTDMENFDTTSTLKGKTIQRIVSDASGQKRVAKKLAIRWVGGRNQDFAVIEVVDDESLIVLYNKLCHLCPALREKWFCFVHRGVPIRTELWDLIEARSLGVVVYIKEGIFDVAKREQTGQMAEAAFDFVYDDPNMLTLTKGDKIVVLKRDANSSWAFGYTPHNKASGWCPENHLAYLNAQAPPAARTRHIDD